jgi:dihydrofolate reductase
MGKVIVGTTMSLDGYIKDRQGSVEPLYPDLAALRETELLQKSMRSTGAVVMGRHAYDMANGDFTDYEYQVPIIVLTHHPPEIVARGANDRLTFTFVIDGIEHSIQEAKTAAGDKDVTVIGGASTAQQCINAGLFDELQIGIVPILLGGGLRFFENISLDKIKLEKTGILESPGRVDLRYRLLSK